MKSSAHFDEAGFTRGILVRELELVSPDVHFLVRFVVLDYYVAWNLCFSTFGRPKMNSQDSLEIRTLVFYSTRGVYFWSNRVDIGPAVSIGVVFRSNAYTACMALGGFALCAIFMFLGRWTLRPEKLLRGKQEVFTGDKLIIHRAANVHWRLVFDIQCLMVKKALDLVVTRTGCWLFDLETTWSATQCTQFFFGIFYRWFGFFHFLGAQFYHLDFRVLGLARYYFDWFGIPRYIFSFSRENFADQPVDKFCVAQDVHGMEWSNAEQNFIARVACTEMKNH